MLRERRVHGSDRAGAWAGTPAATFGEPVPLIPRGPQMAVTEPVAYGILLSIGLFSDVEGEGVYWRQVTWGNVVYGGGRRGPALPEIRRAHVDPANTLSQLAPIPRFACV